MLLGDLPAVTVGHVGGAPVRVDASFALVPLLLASSLTFASLPTTWPWLVMSTAGIFISILLHKIGHSLAARRYGMGTAEIVIGGFYGTARILDHAPSQWAANLVLIAGPLANLALFVWFWGLLGFPEISAHLAFEAPTYRTAVYDVPWLMRLVRTLALLNLSLVLFNMLPAFPLDGGRIYRNLLAGRIGTVPAIRIIAALGVLVGIWCLLGSLRYGTVAGLIALQIIFANVAIFGQPARGASD